MGAAGAAVEPAEPAVLGTFWTAWTAENRAQVDGEDLSLILWRPQCTYIGRLEAQAEVGMGLLRGCPCSQL